MSRWLVKLTMKQSAQVHGAEDAGTFRTNHRTVKQSTQVHGTEERTHISDNSCVWKQSAQVHGTEDRQGTRPLNKKEALTTSA